MIVVYVKHYLNTEGILYFDNTWFLYVKNLIQQQPGFNSIETSKDMEDSECINITVKFSDSKNLTAWVNNKAHQKVINDLDPYRTRPQRWLVTDEYTEPPTLNEWEQAPMPKKTIQSNE